MVIWLKSDRHYDVAGEARVGLDADVIPREAFGTLLEIDSAYVQAQADREAALARAHAEAEAIVAKARAEAQALLDEARSQYEEAAAAGYQDGEERALADWMARQADACTQARELQIKMRERLAQIVTVAVEQIVQVQQSAQLFEKALSTVDRIVEGATYLRVSVSPEDYETAREAFDRLSERWRELGRPFSVSVAADKRLAPGSCLCESDFGAVDASLATQLRAMRSAVSRALKQSVRMEAGAWPVQGASQPTHGATLPADTHDAAPGHGAAEDDGFDDAFDDDDDNDVDDVYRDGLTDDATR